MWRTKHDRDYISFGTKQGHNQETTLELEIKRWQEFSLVAQSKANRGRTCDEPSSRGQKAHSHWFIQPTFLGCCLGAGQCSKATTVNKENFLTSLKLSYNKRQKVNTQMHKDHITPWVSVTGKVKQEERGIKAKTRMKKGSKPIH